MLDPTIIKFINQLKSRANKKEQIMLTGIAFLMYARNFFSILNDNQNCSLDHVMKAPLLYKTWGLI